ncbi:hypothetical protein [Alistipes shahii]|uniref:hypothetical protein n=1 Tax=Alistipes shahii TaxID=328814 RepID=UPI003CFA13B5
MEWSDVKIKIETHVTDYIASGKLSNAIILKKLHEELEPGWDDNPQIIDLLIEDKRAIEIEYEYMFCLSIYAHTDAEKLYAEYLETYISHPEQSLTKQKYNQLVTQDINKLNDAIRQIMRSNTSAFYSKSINGIAAIAQKDCFNKPLDSEEWERYFNILKGVFTILHLDSFKETTFGTQTDLFKKIEQIRHIYWEKKASTISIQELEAKALKALKCGNLFTSKYDTTQLLEVKKVLEQYKYIAPISDNDFLYWFGQPTDSPPQQIEWIKQNNRKKIDKQAITELIVLLCGQTNNPAIKSSMNIEDAPKNQPKRYQFTKPFYDDLKKLGIY